MLSIIVPTYTEDKPHPNLKKLLSNLLIQDTQYEYEVIVVGNPETKPLESLVGQFPDNFSLIQSEIGSNNARNAGIGVSKYDLIALTDDDCTPIPAWVEILINTYRANPNVGIMGGPLICRYNVEKPAWVTGIFPPNLSEVDWGGEVPHDLYPYENRRRHIVSANMAFTKQRYHESGGLDGNIGYHGVRHIFGNDEVQFSCRCADLGDPRMLFVPTMTMYHEIDQTKLNIDYFNRRAYGQGYADGIWYIQENPEVSIEDVYHDLIQHAAIHFVDYGQILEVREELQDEQMTRTYIKNLILMRTYYLTGVQDSVLGQQRWSKP